MENENHYVPLRSMAVEIMCDARANLSSSVSALFSPSQK